MNAEGDAASPSFGTRSAFNERLSLGFVGGSTASEPRCADGAIGHRDRHPLVLRPHPDFGVGSGAVAQGEVLGGLFGANLCGRVADLARRLGISDRRDKAL